MKTKYNEHGEEIPDSTPVEVPIQFRGVPLGTADEVRKAIMMASEEARRAGEETLEESLDFDPDEDDLDDGPSQSEIHDQNEDEVLQFLRAQEARQRAELLREVEDGERRGQGSGAEDAEGDVDEGGGEDSDSEPPVPTRQHARSSERGGRSVRRGAQSRGYKGKGRSR